MTSNTLSNLVAIGVVIVEISFLWLKGKIPHALTLIQDYSLSLKQMA